MLDVACGTGNAALAAARRGAEALGVDPGAGLVELAAARARAAGLNARFEVGDALRLPVEDASFDAVVSVFAVIFAGDADAAVAEMLRAGRRIALSSWIPAGPIATAGRLLWEALPASPRDTAHWGDGGWVAELLARRGPGSIEVREAHLRFEAASPQAWWDEHEGHHPVWPWGRRQLSADRWARLREDAVAALVDGNESPTPSARPAATSSSQVRGSGAGAAVTGSGKFASTMPAGS